jgi:putative heme-binding domain-containing protein
LGEPGIKPVFEKWSSLEQETRATIISGCLASEATTSALLSQVAAGRINVDSFQPAQIEQLRGRKSQELRQPVEKLFGPPPGADRVAIVQEYTSKWPATFDASRGQALYKQHCSQCHQDRVEASGVLPAVGPSLAALAGWKNDAWLTAIFDPNKTVEAKYRRVNILTQDGKTIVGLKVRDGEESIEIVNDQGQLIVHSKEFESKFISYDHHACLDYHVKLTEEGPFSDGVKGHGLLGQTADGKGEVKHGKQGYDAQGEGAIEGVKTLQTKYDVWILTRPSIKNTNCYTEKAEWIKKYLGEDVSDIEREARRQEGLEAARRREASFGDRDED